MDSLEEGRKLGSNLLYRYDVGAFAVRYLETALKSRTPFPVRRPEEPFRVGYHRDRAFSRHAADLAGTAGCGTSATSARDVRRSA